MSQRKKRRSRFNGFQLDSPPDQFAHVLGAAPHVDASPGTASRKVWQHDRRAACYDVRSAIRSVTSLVASLAKQRIWDCEPYIASHALRYQSLICDSRRCCEHLLVCLVGIPLQAILRGLQFAYQKLGSAHDWRERTRPNDLWKGKRIVLSVEYD